MRQRYLGWLLLGKGFFASIALLMVFGAESNAGTPEYQATKLSGQIVYSRPGAEAAVSQGTGQSAAPTWVF